MKPLIALYPFSPSLLPLVRHFDQFQDQYILESLYSFPGSGLIGKDAAYACNHLAIGRTISGEIEVNASAWNTLIVGMSYFDNPKIENHIFTEIKRVLIAGKSVIYCGEYNNPIANKIQKLKLQYADHLLVLSEDDLPLKSEMFSDRYKQIDVPVILIGGLIESSDTLEIILGISAELRKHHIFPSAIVKQPLGRLFGLHSFNSIFNAGTTEIQKIEALNRFAVSIVREERPDVILIEAPDAVFRFSEVVHNGFGIQTYLVSQALRIDYFVCSVPFELVEPSFLESLSIDFSVRLGSPINAVHINNIIGDSVDMLQKHEISYVHATLDLVQAKMEKERTRSPIPLFDIVQDGSGRLAQYLGLYESSEQRQGEI